MNNSIPIKSLVANARYSDISSRFGNKLIIYKIEIVLSPYYITNYKL